ncbi:MAG: UvrD-helicase domain-containing protein [Chloroflexi bacterium]|nr:UvrD-helicase domain-containing protein [Chloroflexota bacterium]MCY3980133.1 UvrD-helicase domain-containing protein [Chloroflexota bacterium]
MRTVYSCRSFDKNYENLSSSLQVSVQNKISDIASGFDGIRGMTKGKKSKRRPYRKAELPGHNRLLWDRQQTKIYLLFVGDHVSYDARWQGDIPLPSLDGTVWKQWEITAETVAPVIRDEEVQQIHDEYAHPPQLGTKGILDNIVGLTPSQQAIVEFNATGPVLIRGVAGSGKTSLGLHRARHIAEARAKLGKETSILLLTRTRALQTAIDWLCANSFPDLPINNLKIMAFGDWMRDLLNERNSSLVVVSSSNRREYIRRIRTEVSERHPGGKALSRLSCSLILSEIDDVIRGRDIRSLCEYKQLKRSGRRRGLNQPHRELVWAVYQKYQQALQEQSMFDWAELPQLVVKHCNSLPEYDVVIVDEAQDLRPNYLNLATKLVKDFSEYRSVTLLGDSAQSIQYQGVSWRDAKLPLSGRRTRVLRENHRNSRQVISAALPVLKKCRWLGNVRRNHSPENIGKVGDKPVLARYNSALSAVKFIADEIDKLSKNSYLNLNYSNFAILSPRTRERSELFNQLWADLPKLNIPCDYFREYDFMADNKVGLVTMQSATGLEFPVVFLIDFEEGVLPYTGQSSTPAEQIEERGRKLAYVSMTRASERLYLVYRKSNPSRFVDDILEGDQNAVVIVDV